jgi:hypothetical protein
MLASTKKFRYAFLPAWRTQTSLTTIAIMAIMIFRAVLSGHAIQKPDLLFNLSIALFCGIFLAIPIGFFRFSVSPEGIRCFNSFGLWSLLEWSSIAYVKPSRYFHLPYLRLTVDGHRTSYWIPLLLSDMEGFRLAVQSAAGIDNPLARALPVAAKSVARGENIL